MTGRTARLGQVATVAAGQPAPQSGEDFGTEGLPFIRAGSLATLVAGADEDTLERVTDESAARNGLRRVAAGAVLFAKSGMSAKIGHVHLLRKPACVVSHLAIVMPGAELDPSYLRRWLEANPPSRLIPNDSYPSIRLDEIERLQIPLPPLAEQHRIAAILDKADAIRRKRREEIRLVENLGRSAFLEIFGDQQGLSRRAETGRLGNLLTFLTSGSRGWAKYYSPRGIPFLRIQNIGANRLLVSDLARVNPPDDAESERTATQAGDVLMSITADLGRTAVIPQGFGRAHINQHLAILRVDGLEPLYLSAFLASRAGKAQIERLNRGGVKAGLNFDDIRSIEIPLPPMQEQKRFRAIWDRAEGLRADAERANQNAARLFDSISRQVFGGRET